MQIHRWQVRALTAAVALAAGVAIFVEAPSSSSADTAAAPSASTCASRPWISASYQHKHTTEALALLVLECLKERYPKSYEHDMVGLVALNSYPWFQNVNEFGLTSTVQQSLASLGMPPITLQDGPGGIITKTWPSTTQLPNELALGATFDPAMATLYGSVLGSQAHAMGYDGVQAPDLNLVRVETWGRAFESFGESPVLAGEMGAAEAIALEAEHVIPVLKHFGPYSQETDRRFLNQVVSDRALNELYTRPFTLVLRALIPQLDAGDHAVGIMCSYGNVNGLKACRSPLLADELNYVGVDALVRSDLDVEVNPSALVLNGVDLVKPMDSGELVASLRDKSVVIALNHAVLQVFMTEFADGLVNGRNVSVHPRKLTVALSSEGSTGALQVEEHAAVLLKDSGVLPLTRSDTRIAVIGDSTVPNSCVNLAGDLKDSLHVATTCTNDADAELASSVLFNRLPVTHGLARRVLTYTATQSGPYVVTVSTIGNTKVTLNGATILSSQGLAEFDVQRTTMVRLTKGEKCGFAVLWKGAPPYIKITYAEPAVDRALDGARGAKVAIVIAYDLAKEGMDRNSIELPGYEDAVISAIAAKVPTIVVLASDGAVSMPWINQVKGVLEVWNPTGSVQVDATLSRFVPAWTKLLDGAVDPSGRLPETFPVTTAQSPAGIQGFWPGFGTNVDLDEAPDDGAAIGMAWYREAGWPVLFPFGFGLSYTTFGLTGGSLQSTPSGLTMTVAVKDTGGDGGDEPVQVYADWPGTAGEPRLQLVGFADALFTDAQADGGVVDVTIPLNPDALTVDVNGAMRLVKGAYCLEAATFDGDPHAWTTGSVTLSPSNTGAQLTTSSTKALAPGTCPT